MIEPIIRPLTADDASTCSFSSRAPAELPCTEPIAVRVDTVQWVNQVHRLGPTEHKLPKSVCANHMAAISPGKRVEIAKKSAVAELILRHEGEYNGLIQHYLQRTA